MSGRTRGSAIYIVLVVMILLGAMATVWRSSIPRMQLATGPNLDRARARAVASGGWAQARALLAAGKTPALRGEAVLGGQATVDAQRVGRNEWTVVVEGRVRSHQAGGHEVGWLISRIVLRVRVAGGRVQVLTQHEEGA